MGLRSTSSGKVWVADSENNRVEEFSESGTYESVIGSNGVKEGSSNSEFKGPTGVAVCNSLVYVVDRGNNRIQYFSTAAKYEGKWGVEGTVNGDFKAPSQIACEAASNDLYVTDTGNNRTQEFSGAGSFLNAFGSAGKGGGEFSAPIGVAVSNNESVYVSDSEDNRLEQFSRPTWIGTIAEGPAANDAQTYQYKMTTVEGHPVIEPVEELGPKPSGVTCSAEPSKSEKGCRELTFKYAEKTTATGESPSEWGEYAGRLVKILFTAYNPATKAMVVEQSVAQYSYDKNGRLRAEWDPRVTPNLKTTYGYDSENDITAVAGPGRQPWLMHYGTFPGSPSPGRLLSVTRPGAATALASGAAPANTAAPTLSSTKPMVGTKISVSTNGTWSNSPLTYSYHWEACNSAGKACAPIIGAVNQSYYPVKSNEGHTLVAVVEAYNATDMVGAASAATSTVGAGTENTPLPEPPSSGGTSVWTVDYQVPLSGAGAPHEMTTARLTEWGQTNDIPTEATAIFSPDEPMGWPAKDYTRATIGYRDSSARNVNTATPTGGISTEEYNSSNEIVRTLSARNRESAVLGCEQFKEGCKGEVAAKLDTKTEYNSEGTDITKITGPQHLIQLKGGSAVEARAVTHDYYDEGAAEVEAVTHEKYNLLTKATSGVLLPGGEEKEARTTVAAYGGQSDLGWKLRAPTSTTQEPGGLNLVHTTVYEAATGQVVETQSPEGQQRTPRYWASFSKYGTEPGDLVSPAGIARDAKGNLWVTNDVHGDGIDEFTSKGEFEQQFAPQGTGANDLYYPEGVAVANGLLYVADSGNNRVAVLNEKGSGEKDIGSKGTEGGKFSSPSGIAIDSKGNIWVVDYGNNRVQELNEKGEFVEAIGFGVSTGEARFQTCTTAATCKAGISGSGEGQFDEPSDIAVAPNGNIYVTDSGNDRVEIFNSKGEYHGQFGKNGSGNSEFSIPRGIAVATNGDVFVTDMGNHRVQEFRTNNEFITAFGKKGSEPGEFEHDNSIALNSNGNAYVLNFANMVSEIQDWTMEAVSAGAHNIKAVYYTSTANSEFPKCGEHPEWSTLACETMPAAQPGTTGMPELPVTLTQYNMWDSPETITETVGTTTRTKKQTVDGAGRATSSEISSSVDTALPKTTNEYNSTTGGIEKQSTTVGSTTKTITSKQNTLGATTEYIDSEGNVAKYNYEEGGPTRLLEISQGKGEEAKAHQTYSYEANTGFMTKLEDSAAGSFSATYGIEGELLTENYPNAMKATYTYNAVNGPTALEYLKSSCAKECLWFSEGITPAAHGEVAKLANTFAEDLYEHDNVGRLTEVQESPAGKYCKIRAYAYDEDSNRTSLQSREPTSEDRCATSGGTTESHAYDPADRLDDPGVVYETFSNITKLPAVDAGGEEITTSYYVDNQVATQKQDGQTLSYTYDPSGRINETINETKGKLTSIDHYDAPGEAVAWVSEPEGAWSRDIPGIDGSLDAIQKSSGSTTLQLHNLGGDIVETASLSPAETKPLTTYNSTEFGVPNEGKAPPKYAWLGATGVASEITFSGTVTDGGGSYVPQIARSLQTFQAVPPGSYPNGSGPRGAVHDEPVRRSD